MYKPDQTVIFHISVLNILYNSKFMALNYTNKNKLKELYCIMIYDLHR